MGSKSAEWEAVLAWKLCSQRRDCKRRPRLPRWVAKLEIWTPGSQARTPYAYTSLFNLTSFGRGLRPLSTDLSCSWELILPLVQAASHTQPWHVTYQCLCLLKLIQRSPMVEGVPAGETKVDEGHPRGWSQSLLSDASGQGATGRKWCTEFPLKHEEELFSCASETLPKRCGVSVTGEPSGHNPVQCALGWPCLSWKVGPHDPLWFLLTWPILWFATSLLTNNKIQLFCYLVSSLISL